MKVKHFLFLILALAIGSLLLSIKLSFTESFRIVFGSFLVLFLPGYTMSFLFFKEIDLIERIALSFALSIAVVPLLMFYINLVGVKINTLNVFFVIAGIILVSVFIYHLKNRKKSEHGKT